MTTLIAVNGQNGVAAGRIHETCRCSSEAPPRCAGDPAGDCAASDTELINDRVDRGVQRELTKKGLREVQPNERPDLVVRYWANSQVQVHVAATGNWGPYGPYLGRTGDFCTTPFGQAD